MAPMARLFNTTTLLAAAGIIATCLGAPAADASTASCCSILSKSLGAKVSFPGAAAYNASTSSYWTQAEEAITPTCIVSVTSAQDVSTALKILVPYACQFAVRSGGHGAVSGIANIQNGVTLDLSALNAIIPSSDTKSVVVGPGQSWGNVYSTLDPLGVSVPGGRVGTVGVGGSTLGGGFNYFAPKAGFACDNVLSYEIVLADGRVVNASKSSYSDLFHALKGSGSNLGIVTNFQFQTYPLPSGAIWAGNAYYPPSTLDAHVQAFYDFIANPNYDVDAGLILNFAFTAATGPILDDTFTYAKPVVNPPAFGEFYVIPNQYFNNTAVTTLGTFGTASAAASPNGLQQITWAITLQNDLPMLHDLWTLFNASTPAIASISSISWSLTLEPFVPAITTQSAARGGNVLGLSVPATGAYETILSATFSSAGDFATVNSAANSLLAQITATAKARGMLNPYVDMNHAGAGQDPIASYGVLNELFVDAIACKYDPGRVFQQLMPGGFKL